jgi:hypothetical protein
MVLLLQQLMAVQVVLAVAVEAVLLLVVLLAQVAQEYFTFSTREQL